MAGGPAAAAAAAAIAATAPAAAATGASPPHAGTVAFAVAPLLGRSGIAAPPWAGERLLWRHRHGGTGCGSVGGGRRWPRPAAGGTAAGARRVVVVAAASPSSSLSSSSSSRGDSGGGGGGGGGASPDEDGVAVRRARGAADVAAAVGVWSAVSGGAVGWEEDVDGAASTTHVIAWAPDGTAVGATRLLREGLNVCISRTAVLPAHRSVGIGRRLVTAAIRLAAPVAGALYVAAGREERGFYSLLGFTAVGPEHFPPGGAGAATSGGGGGGGAGGAGAESASGVSAGSGLGVAAGGRRSVTPLTSGDVGGLLRAAGAVAAGEYGSLTGEQEGAGGGVGGGNGGDAPSGDDVGGGRAGVPGGDPPPPEPIRVMVLPPPTCAPPGVEEGGGCVGLHHAVVRVSDIEVSLAWYGQVGFVVGDKFGHAGHRACFVDGWGTRLELVEVGADGAPGGGGGGGGGGGAGISRLVFDVTRGSTSLDLFLADLDDKLGGRLTTVQPPGERVAGRYVVSVAAVADPDGSEVGFWRREAVVPKELRARVDW